MPRPEAGEPPKKEVASDPPTKEVAIEHTKNFEILLQRLALEFEWLLQENGAMARELSKLGKAPSLFDGGRADEHDRCEPHLQHLPAAEKGPGILETQLGHSLAGLATKPGGNWVHLGSQTSSEAPVFNQTLGEPHSRLRSKESACQLGWRSERERPGPSSDRVTFAAKTPENLCHKESSQASSEAPMLGHISAESFLRKSEKSAWRSERDRASPTNTTPKATILQDIFQTLDESGSGKLSIEDLVRLLSKYREPVDYGSLVNVVRVLNEQDPLEMQTVDEQDDDVRGQGTSIDFAAFSRIMDMSPASQSHLGPNVEACLRSLQRVLCREAPQKAVGQIASHTMTSGHTLGDKSASWGSPHLANPDSPERYECNRGLWLELLPTLVIILNMVVTGLSIDYSDQENVWDTFELFFCIFYLGEWAVKVWIFGLQGFFCGSDRTWNWFDFLCLLVSILDTAVELAPGLVNSFGENNDALNYLMLTKVFRLARLARLVRTLRFKLFYELKLMVMGIVSGIRCLTWALVLLVFLAYPLGVALRAVLGDDLREFNTVPNSVFTLFRCWTDGCSALDGTPLQETLYREYGFAFFAFHLVMTMFVTVGLFNLIMAIFIDNVLNTQAQKKEREMAERAYEIEQRFKKLFASFLSHGRATPDMSHRSSFISRVRQSVHDISIGEVTFAKATISVINMEWSRLRSMNPRITKDMFEEWLENVDFLKLLEDADIDRVSHTELFDVLDADMGGELSLDELVTGLMKLRGPVSKSDIVACRLKVGYLTRLTESYLQVPKALPRKASGLTVMEYPSTRSRRPPQQTQQIKNWEAVDTTRTIHVRQGRD